MIRIRSFQAIKDKDACMKYAEGHLDVLKSYGVTRVTSANTEWIENPSVYVVLVEKPSTGEVLGGAKIHLVNETYPLPIETAISEVDTQVFNLVRKAHDNGGTGELCGLWNARSVAGMGIGTIYIMRAGIAIASQLGISSLFALCAEHTLKISIDKGFSIEYSIGMNGEFFYPKFDLIATSIMIRNVDTLDAAHPYERSKIFDLRTMPRQTKWEEGPKGVMEIEYDLVIQ